ncbi:MAG: tail fiber domain-containing protein [Saprospiraceae bacterium]
MKNKTIFLFAFLLAALSAYSQPTQSQIEDSDGDTNVQTEANPNENRIRFTISGVEVLSMSRTANGAVLFENPGNGTNTFFGINSGASSGSLATLNTFVGNNSGASNVNGSNNTFLGETAGVQNISGISNTFLGRAAGKSNVTHGSNTYVGSSSGANSTSHNNTFLGTIAGSNHTTGNDNTFLGNAAGQHANTGEGNTFVGKRAGALISTGSQNVAIGNLAGETLNCNNATFLGFSARAAIAGLTNSTALGNGATVNASNKIRFGNTAVTVIEGQVAYTVSDGRFKSNIKSDAPGLDFVLGLKPVTYNFDYTDFSKFLGETAVDYSVLAEKEERREMGFVAQDIEKLCREQNFELSNIVHVPESGADNYSVAYGQLVVPLVKAVQEQQVQIEGQQAQIEELKSLVSQLLAVQKNTNPDIIIQTWPNPAGDVLKVLLSGVSDGGTLSLLSVDGKVLRKEIALNGLQEIDLKGFSAGTYLLQANIQNGAIATKPFIKTN